MYAENPDEAGNRENASTPQPKSLEPGMRRTLKINCLLALLAVPLAISLSRPP